MFNKNAYLFPQDSPSCNFLSHHASTSVVGLTDEILFHHHHHDDMLSGHYLAAATAAANAPVVDDAAFFNQDVGGLNGDPYAIVNSCPRAAKKDRHSKIYTAQGPRDRRVRLSIGVARRFFDLQEILGFDKPSKTLDWLLTKSKTAIKDLVQMKENASKSVFSSPSECEVDSAEAFENGNFFGITDAKRKLVDMNAGKHKEAAKDSKQTLDLAKESRVKARARARERTREKMCIKKQLNETRNNGGYDLNPSIPIQYMNNQLEFCKISGSSSSNDSSYNAKGNTGIREAMLLCHPTYGAANEDIIQEQSIVIKRKVKHPSIFGFQQNLIISSSNYGVPSPYSPTDNWDINTSLASQSNICAILDQHKFINGSSNN